jgi:DNA-binding ferritin-like protein (Dps family)
MKTKKIKLEDREVVVKKLPLGDYAEVFKLIADFTKYFKSTTDWTEQNFFEQLPNMLSEAPDKMQRIIVIATDLEQKDVEENIGLDDAIDIFEALFEINNYSKLFTKIKKALAQRVVQRNLTMKTGSTLQ